MTTFDWHNSELAAVVRLIGARTGLSFRENQQDRVMDGIRRAMKRSGIENLKDYRRFLETGAEALDDIVVELTVGETYFFREVAQFEFIRHDILPEIRKRCGDAHVIRAWSAACASGEEAYSLAILFHDAAHGDPSHILATDISPEALHAARKASYRQWSLRGDGAAKAKQYLRADGDLMQLDERIRRRVNFESLNLALDVYPSIVTGTHELDLILCRNVLIYFDAETVRSVARRLHDALSAGGWLITASPDPPLDEFAPFESVVTEVGVFYRRALQSSQSSADQVEPIGVTTTAQDTLTDFDDIGGRADSFDVVPSIDVSPPAIFPPQEQRFDVAAEAMPDDKNKDARRAMLEADYERAIELTKGRFTDAQACVIYVKALANLDAARAETACAELASRHPLSAELHYLHAVLLIENEHADRAADAARRVIYLDRNLALAHFTLGSILRRRGDLNGARRAFRNARNIAKRRPADEIVPLSDGETTAQLVEAAEIQLHRLL